MNNSQHTYSVIWSNEDGEYVGLCAEYPSLSFLAKEPENALNGIHDVVYDVMKDMKNSN